MGANSQSIRQYCVFDNRKLGEQMALVDIDQAAGAFMPYYDPDTSVS